MTEASLNRLADMMRTLGAFLVLSVESNVVNRLDRRFVFNDRQVGATV